MSRDPRADEFDALMEGVGQPGGDVNRDAAIRRAAVALTARAHREASQLAERLNRLTWVLIGVGCLQAVIAGVLILIGFLQVVIGFVQMWLMLHKP